MAASAAPAIPPMLLGMVNHWPPKPVFGPNDPDEIRDIGKQEIYKLAALQALAAQKRIFLATKDCIYDTAEKLEWSTSDVAKALLTLADKHYRGSVWCDTGAGVTGKAMWIPCDEYVLQNYTDDNDPRPWPQVYLKFGLLPSGQTIAMISCHN
jgi:hypothetical protein